MAAKAPRALKTFLDPEFLLLLVPVEPEGLEPLEVPLGEPDETPMDGVEEGSG